MRGKLIVTADDYGMCDSVNRAIEECLAAGVMRSTCVMTNMPCHAEAASLRRRFPECSVGMHWTLTQGLPVLPAAEVPSLVSPNGGFVTSGEMRRRWLRRQVRVEELTAELKAQANRFNELAGPADFWNTHQNIHVIPRLFQLCVEVGRNLGIAAMRCHRRFTIPRGTTSAWHSLVHPLYWLKGRIVDRWSARAEARGVRMPAGRLYAPGYNAQRADFEEVLGRVKWDRVGTALEWVIHPATKIEPELFGGMTESRLSEYRVFSDPALIHRLRSIGIEPAGFEVLHGS